MGTALNSFDKQKRGQASGWIFNIQRYSLQDGPGIRTTVFFKGCPLRCWWCDNPESQGTSPELLYFDSLCVRCYRCVDACPSGATNVSPDGSIGIERSLCKACGKCVEVCLSEARFISGRPVMVRKVLEQVKADSLFYKNSGGGVTASGGEPTLQPDFLLRFFKGCQRLGFTTCLDTCGYVQWELLERILEYTDMVLYDIKHMDPLRHIEFTGVDNQLILENAKRVVARGIPLTIRVPLIPGCNDSTQDLEALGRYVVGLGNRKLELLPYHQLGTKKYERLGQKYRLEGAQLFTEKVIKDKVMLLNSYGLEVEII